MKKITLVVTLLISFLTFAQKDELKALKKIYAKDVPSLSDITEYKSNLKSLETKVVSEEDKTYANFYEGMLPFLELANLGAKVTPKDQLRIFNPQALEKFSNSVTATLDFEKKSGKKIYTDDINETLSWFIPQIEQAAFQLNEAKQYKLASAAFYNLYKLDKESGSNLLNAAILSVQAEDYSTALKLYEEYRDSDYLKNGIIYYATNKLNDEEESFTSKKARKTKLDLKTHEKPREEKVSGRDEILKIIASLKAQTGDIEGAKKAYKDAISEYPDNLNLLIDEANFYYNQKDIASYRNLIKEIIKKDPTNASLYFNIGYLGLSEDVKLVEEINKNLDNQKVYNELMNKRKAMYQSALPYFEESFRLDPNNENTKLMLKSTYQVLGMKEKADKL
jgi:tetratricopeptide (TPR) repeat protein